MLSVFLQGAEVTCISGIVIRTSLPLMHQYDFGNLMELTRQVICILMENLTIAGKLPLMIIILYCNRVTARVSLLLIMALQDMEPVLIQSLQLHIWLLIGYVTTMGVRNTGK